eukprot:889789_1
MTGDQQTEPEESFKTVVESYLAEKSKKSLGELLCIQSYNGDLEFVRYLLKVHQEIPDKIDMNADIPIPGEVDCEERITDLQAAVCDGGDSVDVVLELLNCEAIKCDRDSALITAAEHGVTPVVKTMLEHGSDVNAVSSCGVWDFNEGGTLLLAAVNGNHPSTLKAILESGQPNIDINHWYSPASRNVYPR